MDPYDIEDTSDWLGNPTELETLKHYLAGVISGLALGMVMWFRFAR